MHDLLMILIILLLLLILISALGGSVVVGPTKARQHESFKAAPPAAPKKKRGKKEQFTEYAKQDCVQAKRIGPCDGPCGGQPGGSRKVTYDTHTPAFGGGKACISPSTEPCTNHEPCKVAAPVAAATAPVAAVTVGAFDGSYGLAPF